MPDNVTTDSGNESPYLDEEDWQIALAPYEGRPRDVLSLAVHFAELKHLVESDSKTTFQIFGQKLHSARKLLNLPENLTI